MFSIAYNAVCVPNYSVPTYSLTPTYLEREGLIPPRLKMILIYCIKCQHWAECWFIFFSFQLDICIPVTMDRKCKNNPDRFCYICSNVVLLNCQAKITNFVKRRYHDYFGSKIGDQDEPFAPHVCCKTCVENLRDWGNGKRKSTPSAIPMVWGGRKSSYYGMLFLHDKSKRNKLQEQAPCPIPRFSFCQKTNPSWPRPSWSWARW